MRQYNGILWLLSLSYSFSFSLSLMSSSWSNEYSQWTEIELCEVRWAHSEAKNTVPFLIRKRLNCWNFMNRTFLFALFLRFAIFIFKFFFCFFRLLLFWDTLLCGDRATARSSECQRTTKSDGRCLRTIIIFAAACESSGQTTVCSDHRLLGSEIMNVNLLCDYYYYWFDGVRVMVVVTKSNFEDFLYSFQNSNGFWGTEKCDVATIAGDTVKCRNIST